MSVHVPAKDMHLVGVLSAIFNGQSHICTKMTNIYHSVVSGDISRIMKYYGMLSLTLHFLCSVLQW